MTPSESTTEDDRGYKVVVNLEEQYSIWPDYKPLPIGWTEAGKTGNKADCLAHIREVWTDMRPLSLRRQMEDDARRPVEPETEAPDADEETLVQRLSSGRHPVEVSLRPERTAQALKSRIELGHVHVRFTDTRGGTEFGFELDRAASDLSQADFVRPSGKVHLEGSLTLDGVKVRCIARIDLETLSGEGHLVAV
jgi:uncharacterized protein YbdZ (MbtH family)